MIGRITPAEMRRIVREKLAMTDEELWASYHQKIAEAKAQDPDATSLVETLELLRDALLKETKRRRRMQPKKKRKSAAKK